jgi:hypothetical protein
VKKETALRLTGTELFSWEDFRRLVYFDQTSLVLDDWLEAIGATEGMCTILEVITRSFLREFEYLKCDENLIKDYYAFIVRWHELAPKRWFYVRNLLGKNKV